MIILSASETDIVSVFSRLAPARAAELTATSWHDDARETARELIRVLAHQDDLGRRPPVFALFPDDDLEPAAVVGVLPFGPGLGGMIWAATPVWPEVALPSHRWWRTNFVPGVLGTFRRVEFTALRSDLASRRWLATLGFTEEGVAYRQGKRGEDFVHLAWVNPDPAVGTVT